MAKETTNGLLAGILDELKQLSTETKKLNRTSGNSNAPGNAGIITDTNIKKLDAFGNSLLVLSSAIIPLSNLSSKNIENISNNIKMLSDVLSGIKFSVDNLKSIKNMMYAITSINQVFDSISENFFKSFLKFSPLRAKILGKRIVNFYKILFEQFEQEKFSDLLKNFGGKKDDHISEKLSGFSRIIDSIMKIDTKNLLKLGLALKMFPSEGGKNLAEFFKPILQVINVLPDAITNTKKIGILKLGGSSETTTEVNPKVGAFINIIQLITSITTGQIIKLALMGKLLSKKGGENIGRFFAGIIDAILKNDEKGERAEMASKIIKSMSFLLMTLTISAVALTVLIATVGFGNVVLGFITLGAVVGLSYKIMHLLSSDKFKENSKSSIHSALGIAALIGTLTISLLLLVDIAKKPKKQIIKGLVLFAGIVGAILLIMQILSSDKFKESSKSSIYSALDIAILIGTLTLSLAMVTYVAKKTRQEDMVQGIIMLGTVVTFALGLIWILSRDGFQKNAIKGLAGVGAIVLLIAGTSAAMLIFGEYVKKIDGIKKESAWMAFGLMWAVIGGMVALAAVIGGIWSTGVGAAVFAAAFIGVEMIAAMIASVSGAILLFVKLIEKTKALTKADISTAYDRIIGKGADDKESLVGCLVSIVNAIDENIRWKAAPKIAAIGLALRPVISAISQFVDVIQKMASMQVADQWDKNGNPIHYLKLSPQKFKEAAENLTTAFTTFISNLTSGLDTLTNLDGTKKILKTLFPRNKKRSGGIGNVIRALSDFVDVIYKMASLSVPDQWDKNGNPISYRKLDLENDFKKAAINLSSAFSVFLTELGNGLKGLGVISSGILAIVGESLGSVLQGIGAAFNPIIQIATGKIQVGDKVVDINAMKLKGAANTIISILTDILDFLGHSKAIAEADWNADKFKDTMVDFIDGIRDIDILQKIVFNKDNNVNNLVSGLNIILDFLGHSKAIAEADWNADKFKDTLDDFCDGIKYLNNIKKEMFLPEFAGNTSNLTNGLNGIINYLNDTNFRILKTQSVLFKTAMKNTAAGINHIKPFLSSTPKQIVELANAMKQLDAELITKEEQRTKAIQSVASNFKDMASSINQLNESLSESIRISRLYDQMKSVTSGNIIAKGVSAAVEGAGVVANKVKEVLSDNKTEEQQKTKEEAKQKDREEFANIIASAVSAALTAWSESHKDLTVQFSDSPEKIFGEVYGN